MDEKKLEAFLLAQENFDAAHDLNHVRRVVASAKKLAIQESANEKVVATAAWLHDCVVVPKDSPDRKIASRLAADCAVAFLKEQEWESSELEQVHHAIVAHSFSAAIPCQTLEAKVVQDADRLDALGAIGIARCFAIGGVMNSEFYNCDDPFCDHREPNDRQYAVDHFFAKLFKLPDSMQTNAGRTEATRRADFLRGFLNQLKSEIEL